MSAKTIVSMLSLAILPLFGCAVETSQTVSPSDEEVDMSEDALTPGANRTHFPQCRAIGSRAEGWHWADTSVRIASAQCGGAVVQCGAFGTRSEGWYTGGKLVASDTCATATTARLGGLAAGLQYPSESDVPFDVVLVPGAGGGTLDIAKLRTILKIDAKTPVEQTTVGEALHARRFSEHPDAAKFEALRKGLSGYKAFRVGTIQVQIYFVKVSKGELVGLHTVSIET